MKEWWQDFFIHVEGEIMFTPRAALSKIEVEQVVKQTKLPKQAHVLDLACGVGRHSIEFAKQGFEVVGLDFSKPYLVEATKSALKTKTKIKFVNGDMKNLRPHFNVDSFDLVVSLYNSFGYFKSRSDDLRKRRTPGFFDFPFRRVLGDSTSIRFEAGGLRLVRCAD